MSLRTLNVIAAVIHAAQAIAVAIVLGWLPPMLLPVTASFGGGLQLAEVNVGAAAVVVLAFSSIVRAIAATGRWERLLRWIEYSQVSAVSLFLAAQLNGIRDIASLVPIYAITAGVVFFLVPRTRSSFSFGAMVGIVPWGVVAFYQIGSTVVGDGPTALVRIVTVGLLVLAASYWVFVRRPSAARAHVVILLLSNAFLAWMLVIAAMPQTYA